MNQTHFLWLDAVARCVRDAPFAVEIEHAFTGTSLHANVIFRNSISLQAMLQGNTLNLTCEGKGIHRSYILAEATQDKIDQLCNQLCS